MRKYIKGAVPVLLAGAMLCSCSDNTIADRNTMIDDIINEAVSSAEAENSAAISVIEEKAAEVTSAQETAASSAPAEPETSESTSPRETAAPDTDTNEPVDMDLTTMNATMIYSIIYDLMIKPNDYYGKSLMVDGYFDTMYDENLGTRYYFVVVPDATACCVQGLEFKLSGDTAYPDGYPEPGTDIRVRGVLGSYDELGQTYAYIQADRMIVL